MADTARDLTDRQKAQIRDGYCPDCNHRGFVLGPSAYPMMNVECGNVRCKARFNVCLHYLDSAYVFAHRLPRQKEGGVDWTRRWIPSSSK